MSPLLLVLFFVAPISLGFGDMMTHFQYKDSNMRVESFGSIASNTIKQMEEVVEALERMANGERENIEATEDINGGDEVVVVVKGNKCVGGARCCNTSTPCINGEGECR